MQPLSVRLPGRALTGLPAKVAFFVLLTVAVRGVVVGWQSLDLTRGFFRQVVERTFPESVERTARVVEAWLDAGRAEVELAAGQAQVARLAAQVVRSEQTDSALSPSEREALEGSLGEALRRAPALDALWIADARGRIRFASGSPRPPESLPPALLRPGLQVLPRPGAPPLPIALVGIGDTSEPRAWLVGRFAADALARILPWDSLPGVGRAYLVDAQGRPLFGQGLAEDARPAIPVERALAADERTSVEYRGIDGEPRIAAVRPLPHLGWHVAVIAHLDQGFRPVLPLMWHIFLLDLLVVLAVAWIAYHLTARIVRPVQALWDGARRIAEGDREVEVPEPGGNDEIAELTRTFNAMARTLREDQVEIEAFHRQLREQNHALQAANEVLAQLSITDGLTKLHNHRFFQDHLTRELKRVSRTGEPLAMLLIDIDDFKSLNDRYGHATGDAILVRISQVMNASVRESDLLARYGGEEFVVLASTDLEGAITLAEKLRMAVMETPVLIDEAVHTAHVTVSIGVAVYRGDRKTFFRAADRALYAAKATGKNCVIVDEESARPC